MSTDVDSPTRQTRPDWRERLRTSRLGTMAVLVVTTLLVMVGAWFVQQSQADDVSAVTTTGQATSPPPEVGKPAADFVARTIDGREVNLSDYRGRPVWVLFGASWCASCRAEAPDVEAVYQEAKDSGVEIISVYLAEDAMTVRGYTQSTGLSYMHVPDPVTNISSEYRVMGIPAHYFIDTEGNIDSIQVGAINQDQMRASLATLTN
ncbi:MAG: TlpA disulfide reductase family protein [Mobilicoccus sp.]|nr:TlpA disulfide reductase family protein [Mobilicoccus sp.]